MKNRSSVEIVEHFWRAVWQARNPDAIDDFVTEDFIITSAGTDIVGREAFKEWAHGFLAKISDFEFDIIESFQSADGSRVASRWRIRGRNNGIMGTEPRQQALDITGTAIWEVSAQGELRHNWVERAAHETYMKLTAAEA
jgi:limonene-1,2-epoxide hydrolase